MARPQATRSDSQTDALKTRTGWMPHNDFRRRGAMHARDVISEQVERFNRDGYLIVPGALSPEELVPIRKRFHEVMPAEVERQTREKGHVPLIVELTRIIERDPVFEPLMDWHRIFPLVRAIIGRDVTLA